MKKTTKIITKFACVMLLCVWSSTNAQSIWTGAINSDWENSLNWIGGSPGLAPVGANITIPVVGTYPEISNDITLDGGALTVDPGASLSFNPNVVLTNNGAILNSGTVTFESDASGSAYIANGIGLFLGDYTIERYIPARRAFRFLSSPVSTTTTIRENWQNNGVEEAGKGTDITGSSGAANGFDATGTNNASMFSYNNSTQLWVPVTNTNVLTLAAGTPYRIMIRGDRFTDLTNNAAISSVTTLSVTGTINDAPPLTLNGTAGGFSLIGNPYQAPVDISATLLDGDTSNLNTSFYWVWDPTLGVRGAYTTVSLPGGTATGGSAANNYIQPGQAVFIQTVALGAAAMSFKEAYINTSVSETAVFKSAGKKASNSVSQLSLNLYETNALTENETATDGVLIFFDETYSNHNDVYDAAKFSNLDETFATSNDGELLSIERRAIPTETDEIPLSITTYRNTNYTIVAKGSSLIGETAFLVDTYTGDYTEIPDNGTVNYSYTIDENEIASQASDRFKINFAQKSLSTKNITVDQIQIYPNPSIGGKMYLQVPQNMDDLEISIYNALGLQVYHSNGFSSGSKATISTDFATSRGVYFVKLSSDGNEVTKKLMIN